MPPGSKDERVFKLHLDNREENGDDDDIDNDGDNNENISSDRIIISDEYICMDTVQAMYIYVCVYTVYLYICIYIYARRQWRNGVNGQSATYQLGNQWYRLPARSNVRHAVDSAVERIVARMSGT